MRVAVFALAGFFAGLLFYALGDAHFHKVAREELKLSNQEVAGWLNAHKSRDKRDAAIREEMNKILDKLKNIKGDSK